MCECQLSPPKPTINPNIFIILHIKRNLMFAISAFIKKELENRITDYTNSPNYILEHYEAEKQNIASYNGRQLLEMLQNADDAAKTAKNKKAYIELSANTLRISNNGERFDQGGFTSLMYIHRSGKRMKADMIGQKGLGFRSILSWAKKVIVESGEEQVAFSADHAQAFLKTIITGHPHVQEFLKEEAKENFPIATLRIPQIVENPVLTGGYDTSIIVELKNNIQGQVKSQMKNRISMKTMLFLKSLDEIELKCEGYHRKYTRIKRANSITVTSHDLLTKKSVSKTWNIEYEKGKHKNKLYEIALAWNDELDDDDGNIYTYFETKSKLSFPGTLHASFELGPDRNHLIDDPDGHNAFLTEKIAGLIVRVAELIAAGKPSVSYEALKLINIDFDQVDQNLKDFGLEEMVLEAANDARILPTVNNKYIKGTDKFIYYPLLAEPLFYGDDVEELLIYSPSQEIDELLELLIPAKFTTEGIYQLVSSRLGKVSKPTYAKMLAFVFENADAEQLAALHEDADTFRPLFLDNSGNPILWGSQIFMQNQEMESFKLPSGLDISILDNELFNQLEQLYIQNGKRKLKDDLDELGIKEYNFLEIVSAIANHYKDTSVTSQVEELHQFIFPLYVAERTRDELAPTDFDLPVISQKKNVIAANSIYFGKTHGEELCEQLYRYDRNKILCDYERYGLVSSPEELKAYFTWLGVAYLPRHLIHPLRSGTRQFDDFADYVLRGLDFRKTITDYDGKYRNYNELSKSLKGVSAIRVSIFDGMEQILLKAKTEDIFLWIKTSNALKTSLEENRELYTGAYLHLEIRDKTNLRTVGYKLMPSFIRWIVSETPWLPAGKTGLKSAPASCCLSKTITAEFSPFLERPSDALSKVAEKVEIHLDQLDSYLVNCGVHREISSFSLDTLYGMLLALPKSDNSRKAGPSIYREIISNFDDATIDISHPMYQRFIKEGEVVCEMGGKRDYYPVSNSYYIQSKKYGNNLLRKFPLIHIDRKRGPKKVNTIFGVPPLTGITFELKSDPVLHGQHAAFAADFARFKALVYTLRMDIDTTLAIKTTLKKLRILLVKQIDADYIHKDVRNPMELEEFEFINKGKTYYILLPEVADEENGTQYIGLADAVAEIMTDNIGTEEYRSFIRELFNTNELSREALLIRELQLENNERLLKAKMELNIVDDIRFSFWRAFHQATNAKVKCDLSSESGLKQYMAEKLALSTEEVANYMDLETYSSFGDLAMQEQIYSLFIKHKLKFPNFSKLFTDLSFTTLFKDVFQNVKKSFAQNFECALFEKLSTQNLDEKARFFEHCTKFDKMQFQPSYGFITDMHVFLQRLTMQEFGIELKTQMDLFSIDDKIKAHRSLLETEGIAIPPHVLETYEGLAFILFYEGEALLKLIQNTVPTDQTKRDQKPDQSEITFAGINIVFTDYKSLAQQIMEKVDFKKGKIKNASTIAIQSAGTGGSKTGEKESVRFVSDLDWKNRLDLSASCSPSTD